MLRLLQRKLSSICSDPHSPLAQSPPARSTWGLPVIISFPIHRPSVRTSYCCKMILPWWSISLFQRLSVCFFTCLRSCLQHLVWFFLTSVLRLDFFWVAWSVLMLSTLSRTSNTHQCVHVPMVVLDWLVSAILCL